MVTISPKALDEYKQIFKKEYGKEPTNAEALDGAQRLLSFVEIIYEISLREAKRKKRLEKEPKGFHLEEDGGQYNCLICHELVSGKQGWWDINGTKCLDCQRSIDMGIVPASICRNRESWYASWELTDKFGIHPSTTRKLIREGKLKVKNLTTENGSIYFQVFLAKENPTLKKRKII